jgi:hypothetical protein
MQLCRIDQAAGLAFGDASSGRLAQTAQIGIGPREHDAHAASDLLTHGM